MANTLKKAGILWLIAISLAFVLTTVFGLMNGFPLHPDKFSARAAYLHEAAMAGVNLDDVLVAEHSPELKNRIPEPRYGFIGDVVRVVQWYKVLFAVLYFVALLVFRVDIKATMVGSLIGALIFFYSFGASPALLLLVAGLLYALFVWFFVWLSPRKRKSG